MKKFLKRLSGIDRKANKKEEEETIKEKSLLDYDYEQTEWITDEYDEGQLSIDVYQTDSDIVVKSTIAGVKPEDIDISINNDMLTIKGKRSRLEKIEEENYLFRECYWGGFSRSIILPVEIKTNRIEAFIENGVLTVKLPKAKTLKEVSIKVKEK